MVLVRTADNKWSSRPGQAALCLQYVRYGCHRAAAGLRQGCGRLGHGCGTAAARPRHSMATTCTCTYRHSWSLLGFSGGMPRIGSRRPRTTAKPESPLELVNSTFSTSHAPDMHSLIFCVSAEYLRPACEQKGEPPAGGSVRGSVRGSVQDRAARVISSGSARVDAAATGAAAGSDASSGTTSPFWYIRVGAAAGSGASSANAGSTAAHKLPASKTRREVVGLPHGRSADAAESSAQSTSVVLITRSTDYVLSDLTPANPQVPPVFACFGAIHHGRAASIALAKRLKTSR